jgi:subtilisin family serine protease
MPGSDDAGFRGWRFETFEERLALSIQPVADFWYDTSTEAVIEPSSAVVQPLGGVEGHGWTELAAARARYGLDGGGQTVAVIDSGIAYDHVALGGGLGNSFKVVGGWDFAENDANPYDDAPAGFHGTHVAGIVGAQDTRYAGVAPGVDLVSLRVFNDQGGGYFSWVEQALSWVHQHRNDYGSPITTVNLSLGTEWNSTALPQWATLENELKQLADDGIFVAVAAGNSFLTYNAAGLSYPAVSPYVSAVASTDASGNLSRFSQRSEQVLAAPGEKVMSTLPDAFYGGDGIKNDWGAASGTSMAAPYVAGASVLVREQMQNLGYTQITAASINNLLHRTADTSVDPITRATFHRVNVGRALSTLTAAPDNTVNINGTTAIVTGTAASDTFTWQAATQELTVNGVRYSLTGITQIAIDGGSGNDSLALSGGSAAETVWLAPKGGELTAANFRLTAAGIESIQFVGNQADRAWLYDSAASDVFEATPQWARLSGAGFANDVSGVGSVVAVSQAGGGDLARLYDSAGNDVLVAGPTKATLQGSGFFNEARGFSQVVVLATAGGYDAATLNDSAGADQLDASARFAWLRGSNFSVRAEGFDSIVVSSTYGSGDVARLWGSAGNDSLSVWSYNRTFYSTGVVIQTFNFRHVSFDGGGGIDNIDYYSSSKGGRLYGRSHYGAIVDQVFETQFSGIESLLARVRSSHKLKTDLAALEFYYQRIGRK